MPILCFLDGIPFALGLQTVKTGVSMEIFTGMRSLSPQAQAAEREKRSAELRKKDLISDLFNNQATEESERGDVKLRLSKTSRVLGQRLQQASAAFLKEHQDVRQALDRVPLNEDGYANATRQLKAYVNWLDIRQPEQGELDDLSSSEQAYMDVHGMGKDEQIRELFHDYEDQRQNNVAARTRHSPNYYYLAYPETYSFN